MAIFSNKKHTSKLYKVVANSIKKDQTISKGLGKKQSKQTSPGDRKYDPMSVSYTHLTLPTILRV